MLNKEMCKRCCELFYVAAMIAEGKATWEVTWSLGFVWCPSRFWTGTWTFRSSGIEKPPSEFCPYAVEHVVSQDAE